MRTPFRTTLALVAGFTACSMAPAFAADQAQMMTTCNTYAARHLGVSTSDIAELTYQGQRVDGTHAVNGATTRGETFQCSFNSSGSHVVSWYQSGQSHVSSRPDEAQMMTSCNSYAAKRLGVSTSEIAELSYEGQRVDGTHAVNGTTSFGQSFQCSFNSSGTRISHWYHSAPQGCPFDVSQADRYLYPDCD